MTYWSAMAVGRGIAPVGSSAMRCIQARSAISTALLTASAASTMARTGPTVTTTAGMRVSRSTGSRIPTMVGSLETTPSSAMARLVGQGAPAERFEMGDGEVGNRCSRLGARFETDVHGGTEPIGGRRVGTRLVLVGRHHGRAVVAERSGEAPRDGTQAAELPDHDAGRLERRRAGTDLVFADRRDTGSAAALAQQPFEHADRGGTAHSVGVDPAVALEVDERAHGGGSQDAVGPTAVETEVVQALLQGDDVVTTHLRALRA